MSNNDVLIRDFIYVDAERLYSLYSQVFEGVADQIVESFIAGLSTTDSQKGTFLQGSSIETQIAEASRRTENKSLYDHMYNQLERKLHSVIVDASKITTEDYQSILDQTFMIKVSGTAEIEDYHRLAMFMERFNEIADAIGYSQLVGIREVMNKGWTEEKQQIKQITDRNQKSTAKRRLEKKKKDFERKIEDFLEQTGLRQDETSLSNLCLFIEMFNPEGFEITISPIDGDGSIVYRGILGRQGLRIQPDFLRALYGSAVESTWTMVGKVTYIPSQIDDLESADLNHEGKESVFGENRNQEQTDTQETQKSEESEIEELISDTEEIESATDEEKPSMRDPFRNMFNAASSLSERKSSLSLHWSDTT